MTTGGHCPDAGVYIRPTGHKVCLGCAALWTPEAGWQQQTIRYCAPGLHRWGQSHPRQCLLCPAVERAEIR